MKHFLPLCDKNVPTELVPFNSKLIWVGLENLGEVNCYSTSDCTPHLTWTDGTAFGGPQTWINKDISAQLGHKCFKMRVSNYHDVS